MVANPIDDQSVTLVIPAHNAEDTIRGCLESAVPLLQRGEISHIVVVDDASTDATAAIVQDYPATCIKGPGTGAGGARNRGWNSANTPLVWFVDADCVIEDDALQELRPHLADSAVGAVGGSYGNMRPDSLVASLIHEEIVQRHLRMPRLVSFLATFNLLARRAALDSVGGFDERFFKAQDAELAYALQKAGWKLGFEMQSRVRHHHLTSLRRYLRVQRQQGYWRMWLYARHTSRAQGDSYSGLTDYLQPPLAMLSIAALSLVPWSIVFFGIALFALWALQLPMTVRLVRRTGSIRYLAYMPFGVIRAYWRGVGMTGGVLAVLKDRLTFRQRATDPESVKSQH